MVLHHQPQGHRHPLHHHITVPLRSCGRPRDHNEDATLSPRQYYPYSQCLQSIRHCSRSFDGFLDNTEFYQFSCYDVQDESPWPQAEVHVCVSMGYSRNDFHDALCVPIVSRSSCLTLCRQGLWYCVFLVDPGWISSLGQCVLVLRAS